MEISKIIFILLFGIFVFISTVGILFLIDNNVEEPKTLVTERTSLTKSDFFHVYEVTKYPSKVHIVDMREEDIPKKLGISTESWVLDFGILPSGENSVKKIMTFNNSDGEEKKVNMVAFGNISDMVSFSNNNFYLEGFEEISVFLNATEDTREGNYTGEIDIVIQRKRFG